MLQKYKQHFAQILSKYFSDLDEHQILSMIELVPDNIKGDLGFPCFRFAKAMKKSPHQIAADIVGSFQKNDHEEQIIPVGPYVNFIIPTPQLSEFVLEKIHQQGDKFGQGQAKHETVLIESPGPNTNKPLHLGHVRNMLLGNSQAKIMKFAGYEVKKVDIINDRGIHICKSMLAYQKFGQGKTPEDENKKPDHFVGDWYVEYSKQLEDHPEMEEEIKQMLLKREAGDEDIRALWKKMNTWTLEGMKETYKRFGTHIDKAYFESDHYLAGKDIVLQGLKQGVFSTNIKGNIVFKTSNDQEKTVLRADGTSIYSTNDLATVQARFDDFKMERMIYVVGNEQKEYFESLFEIFEALGYTFADKCFHLNYGMISLPSGKMKSREGTVVDADNLADDMQSKALELLDQRNIHDADKAEAIAMGAIKFYILKHGIHKNFVFDPQKSLSFEGETGPYLQYTYARCCSIMRNAPEVDGHNLDKTTYNTTLPTISEKEHHYLKNILLHISQFSETVQRAAQEYKPNYIAQYIFDLAQEFNTYYAHYKILTTKKDLTAFRLQLVMAVRQVLENGLRLLGIETVEKM